MKKLIIINPCDFGIYDDIYYGNIIASKMFYQLQSFQYMYEHQIEIISLVSILRDPVLKHDLLNNTYNDQNITHCKETYNDALCILMKNIEETDIYDQSVIYIISDQYANIIRDHANLFSQKKIKIICFATDITVIEHKPDVILFPSLHPNHETCNDQILFYVPPLSNDLIHLFYADNFFNRNKKVLMLTLDSDIISSMDGEFNHEYLELSDTNVELNIVKKTFSQYYHYLRCISNYQAVFCDVMCLSNKTLYIIFEILATKTLLISNNIEILSNIGLISYVHYVPISEELIHEHKYWAKIMNTEQGKQIASNGYDFIKKYFYNLNHLNFFINLINNLENNCDVILIDSKKIEHYQGNMYKYHLNHALNDSVIKLYENQIELISSQMTDIIHSGSKRFLYQNGILYFSSSDNSNPKHNQKIYHIFNSL